jgi:hypothetical protein
MPDTTIPDYRLAYITVIDFLRELFPDVPALDFHLEVSRSSKVILFILIILI